jgi:hypothetical protein
MQQINNTDRERKGTLDTNKSRKQHTNEIQKQPQLKKDMKNKTPMM